MTSSSYPSHMSTPTLAGVIASVVLFGVGVMALLRFWMRRRRAPNSTSGMFPSPSDHTPFTPVLVRSRSRTLPKWQADDGFRDESTDAQYRVVSRNERGAQERNATRLERAPAFDSPSAVRAAHEDGEQELPSPRLQKLVPPPTEASSRDRQGSPSEEYTIAIAAAEPLELGTTDVQGERLLHFALPWVLVQRVLAMMVREDTGLVESGQSEPLSAYEPRGQ